MSCLGGDDVRNLPLFRGDDVRNLLIFLRSCLWYQVLTLRQEDKRILHTSFPWPYSEFFLSLPCEFLVGLWEEPLTSGCFSSPRLLPLGMEMFYHTIG